jgi:hypothetical protein
LLMAEDILKTAHDHSFKNRPEVTASDQCGCFYCLSNFLPSEISEWLKEKDGQETAVCPKCFVDSVIGSASGFPITADFMQRMHDYWFSAMK